MPADVPTTGPNLRKAGERPPVEPLAATAHTPSGARAFGKFFILTLDWGFATTSGAYMRHYFEPTCIECQSHARGQDNTRKAGDHYIGGRFTIKGVSAGAIGGPHGADLSIVVTFDVTSVEAVDAKGRFKNAEPAHPGAQRELWLAWREGAWTVVDMAPQ